MITLVFGKTGQVASELAFMEDLLCLSRSDADLADPTACAKIIFEVQPKAVINAAAYTAVDKAEEEEALAEIINGDAPKEMAKACKGLDIPFINISTDYVFDEPGSAPNSPNGRTYPSGAYGRSKLKGEIGIKETGANSTILRTSWVFSSHGHNFVKTMLRLANDRDNLSIVADQFGGPTSAKSIAQACYRITKILVESSDKSGTYHFSGAPNISWAEFAREIFYQANRPTTVTGIKTSEYPTIAKRPLNSRLDCTALKTSFDISQPDWRKDLKLVLQELGEIRS
jgi:dTDP-4-dehydrorhamnose reductase